MFADVRQMTGPIFLSDFHLFTELDFYAPKEESRTRRIRLSEWDHCHTLAGIKGTLPGISPLSDVFQVFGLLPPQTHLGVKMVESSA